jgi:hypothetical protein
MVKQTIQEHILKLYISRPAILFPFILILQTGCATMENLNCLGGREHEQIAPSSASQSWRQKKLITYQDNDSKVSRNVYRIGTDPSKPPVILLHELPGPSIQTFATPRACPQTSLYIFQFSLGTQISLKR